MTYSKNNTVQKLKFYQCTRAGYIGENNPDGVCRTVLYSTYGG